MEEHMHGGVDRDVRRTESVNGKNIGEDHRPACDVKATNLMLQPHHLSQEDDATRSMSRTTSAWKRWNGLQLLPKASQNIHDMNTIKGICHLFRGW